MPVTTSTNRSPVRSAGWIALALAAAAAAAGCAPVGPDGDPTPEPAGQSTAALTGPSVAPLSNTQYRYFGRLHFGVGPANNPTWFGCSGTLIGQNRVLTAAHCAVCASQAQMRFFNPPADGAPAAPYWTAQSIELHPVIAARVASGQINCNGDIDAAHNAAGGAFDLAVVTLSTAVSPRYVVGLPAASVYTFMGNPSGFAYMNQTVTHLGVGGDPFGTRRVGTAALTSTNFSYWQDSPYGASFAMATARTLSAAEGGDSGGPIIWSSPLGDRVVGITSLVGPDGNDHYAPTYAAGTAAWLRWRLDPSQPISCSFGQPCPPPPPDADHDGVVDAYDNCPANANSFQQTWACSP